MTPQFHPPPNHTMHNKEQCPAWHWKSDLERAVEAAIQHFRNDRYKIILPLNRR